MNSSGEIPVGQIFFGARGFDPPRKENEEPEL
jgi:hypothetical protein